MAELIYGAGLRVHECVILRIKDVDMASRALSVRNSKGSKDRTTVLPERLISPLQQHLLRVAALHRDDQAKGGARCFAKKISVRLSFACLAICLSFGKSASVGFQWSSGALAYVRFDDSAGVQAGNRAGRSDEACERPLLAPQFCNASSGGWDGYSDDPVAAGSQQPEDDDDPYPCTTGHQIRHESIRFALVSSGSARAAFGCKPESPLLAVM